MESERVDNSTSPAQGFIGQKLNHLKVVSRIGSGGIGDVYLAEDLSLDRHVAVKVLNARMSSDQSQILRFQREARACARLDHRNIVRVWQVDRFESNDGVFRYMVMEYVPGVNLATTMRERRGGVLDTERALEITLGVAKALRHAHARQIVHRDIKPANILLREDDGAVKVVDFGLARIIENESQDPNATNPGAILGTPNYLSPEQAKGMAVDGRSDVYSLGITLYEMLVGMAQFDGDSIFTIVHSHFFEPITFPDQLLGRLDAWIVDLVERMCHKVSSKRPSADEVVATIQRHLESTTGSLSTTSIPIKALRVSNIRKRASSFIGRESEKAELQRAFRSNSAQVITIVGPAGVGKTRLVEEAAEPIAKSLGAGVRMADLSLSKNQEALCRAIGDALEMQLQEEDLADALLRALSLSGPFLLVLDNAERCLADLSPLVSEAVASNPELRVLITSREALRIDDERVIRLLPLESGDASGDAVRLFLARAREARYNFALADGEMKAVLDIADRLDGMPLAIELAAARAATMAPKQILERMESRFDLLRSNRRDTTHRSRTMEAAIGWSWDMLSEDERIVLVQLSVFRGGFFLEDLEEVVDLSKIKNAGFALDIVEGLADKSLLRGEDVEAIPGEVRLRPFASVSEFAALRLIDGEGLPDGHFGEGLREEIRARHAEYFRQKAISLRDEVTQREGHIAVARLGLEVQNLETAHKYLISKKAFKDAVPIAVLLEEYWAWNGPWNQRLNILNKTLAIATSRPTLETFDVTLATGRIALDRREGEALAASVAKAREIADQLKLDDPKRLLELRAAESEILRLRGRYDEAQVILDSTFEEFNEEDEFNRDRTLGLAKITRLRGMICFYRGEYEDAIDYFFRAESDCAQCGDRYSTVKNLNNRGLCLLECGQHRRGIECLENGLSTVRLYGRRRSEANCLSNLSSGHLMCRDYAKAIHCGKRAEEIFRSIGDALMVANTMINIGSAHEGLRDFPAAYTVLADAVNLTRAVKDQGAYATAVFSRANVEFGLRNWDAARDDYLEAAESWGEVGFLVGKGSAIWSLSLIETMKGDLQKAFKLSCDAEDVLTKAQSTTCHFELWLWRAYLHVASGEKHKAKDLLALAEKRAEADGIEESRPFLLAALRALIEESGSKEYLAKRAEAKKALESIQGNGVVLEPHGELLASELGIQA